MTEVSVAQAAKLFLLTRGRKDNINEEEDLIALFNLMDLYTEKAYQIGYKKGYNDGYADCSKSNEIAELQG